MKRTILKPWGVEYWQIWVHAWSMENVFDFPQFFHGKETWFFKQWTRRGKKFRDQSFSRMHFSLISTGNSSLRDGGEKYSFVPFKHFSFFKGNGETYSQTYKDPFFIFCMHFLKHNNISGAKRNRADIAFTRFVRPTVLFLWVIFIFLSWRLKKKSCNYFFPWKEGDLMLLAIFLDSSNFIYTDLDCFRQLISRALKSPQ